MVMNQEEEINILLVDDQPAKLLSYETILRDLKVNLIKAPSGREALEQLLTKEVALVLMDVCMPDLDGFQLAEMIRDHPRFEQTAIIFISAIHLTDVDFLRGYEMGAVDYVPVPVVPEVLRAKVKVFVELHRKREQLAELNRELESRVSERTEQLETYAARLLQSEHRRTMALAAGQMGSWDWDIANDDCVWDEGQYRIFGVDPEHFEITAESIQPLIDADDWTRLRRAYERLGDHPQVFQLEFRVYRPNGEIRWCIGTAATTKDSQGRIARISGVTMDITERKDAEQRQVLLAREVDHRAKNTLAVIQSIVRLTRSDDIAGYIATLDGRLASLSRAHTLLSESRWQGADLGQLVAEEFAAYRSDDGNKVCTEGPRISLTPPVAQAVALALHELVTNSAKYGALSTPTGSLGLVWDCRGADLILHWTETGGPPVTQPSSSGFGTKIINATIGSQLGGHVTFEWRPAGLKCVMSLPMQRENARAQAVAGHKRAAVHPSDGISDPSSGANRILIVEDEALVAMMMENILVDLGFAVVGPCNTAADALAAARSEAFEAAILDVNLGGQLVYPTAEVLLAKGVPFVFITGYGQESIDPRFTGISVLHKPVTRDVLQTFLAGRHVLANSAKAPGAAA